MADFDFDSVTAWLGLPSRAHVWAHSPPPGSDQPHLLDVHLRDVARLASEFADSFGAAELGYWEGLLHDLGKLRELFQKRVHGENSIRAPHAIYGAYLLVEFFDGAPASMALAAVIAGHHAGLPDFWGQVQRHRGNRPRRTLQDWLGSKPDGFDALEAELRLDAAAAKLPDLPRYLQTPPRDSGREVLLQTRRSFEMFVRMLFSALVDADWLDTSAFYQGERASPYGAIPDLRRALDESVDQMVSALSLEDRRRSVNILRGEVLEACRQCADEATGFFSLTVPTGGGKTLAGLSFALRHAERHGLRRVIAAIPYTSILEQNAAVYREHLDPLNVVEHHSALDTTDRPEEMATAHELSTENWDAPVIVTTNVQLFESLFSNRPSDCRKLHRIARSVILLDEAQVLPGPLLVPILDVLRELVTHYGCTVVLTTATRPAFDVRDSFPAGLENVREIAPDPAALADRLRRVDVEWRCEEPVAWSELAKEVAELGKSALVVVHSRSDARGLAILLNEIWQDEDSVFHLSAAMYPAHRSQVLAKIKARLKDGERCLVVSTQLIEAGVDIDFPVVFRALAGLDSLVQAMGRCNREGSPGRGRFVIFRSPTSPPPGAPLQGLEVTDNLLVDGTIDLYDPKIMERYFRQLYQLGGDKFGIQEARENLAFATVARVFKLIDEKGKVTVLVPWGEGVELMDTLETLHDDQKPSRELYRRLQRFTVGVPSWAAEELIVGGHLRAQSKNLFMLSDLAASEMYSEFLGLDQTLVRSVDPSRLIF